MFEEGVEDDLSVVILLCFNDDTHTVAVCFFAKVCDAFNLLVFDLLCDVFDELCLVDLIGDFGDDDSALSVGEFLNFSLCTEHCTALAGAVCLFDTASAEDKCACGIVGSRDIFHQIVNCKVGILDECNGCINNFTKVVGRN